MTDRERFEACVVAQGLPKPLRRPNGDYWSSHVHIAWAFWQASRKQAMEDALEQCKALADFHDDECPLHSDVVNIGASRCVESIRCLANPEGEQG